MDVEMNKLDLSGKCLKKLPPNINFETASKITELYLDNNEFPNLERLELFPSVVELSASHNKIMRLFTLGRLVHLVKVDLSYNQILTIEGLKQAVHLKYLNLAHNRIKQIQNLRYNTFLEVLDLSENNISQLANIKELVNLKKLLLHKNQLTSLKKADKLLPSGLETLTLAGNKITDLNEVSQLSDLKNIREISITANPCTDMTSNKVGFDYRPFLVNWLLEVKIIDGFVVDEIESLKGEWLYSQGRGRQFKLGQHDELVQYLADACPLTDSCLQSENERKLRLILSKAHHHQLQLRLSEDQGSPRDSTDDCMVRSLDPSILSRNTVEDMEKTGPGSRVKPRADFHDCMIRSLDPSVLTYKTPGMTDMEKSMSESLLLNNNVDHELTTSTKYQKCLDELSKDKLDGRCSPLPVATKLVPVPESLVSPMVNTAPSISSTKPSTSNNISQQQSIEEDMTAAKLQTIKSKAKQMREIKLSDTDTDQKEHAATVIQKCWRGYQARNLDPKVLRVYQKMRMQRNYSSIMKLRTDMEATQTLLDKEHRLQVLQMQAITALWRKVSALEPQISYKELSEMCTKLNSQVQQLQSSMKEILRCVSPGGRRSREDSENVATQTDVIAVRTPVNDKAFPFSRPKTLTLMSSQPISDDSIEGGSFEQDIQSNHCNNDD